MITVVHVIVGLDVGGAELMLQRLVLNSQKRVRHVVISLTNIGEIGGGLRREGIQVYTLGFHRFWQLPLVFWRLIKCLISIKPDVVHTWMYHSDLIGGMAAKFVGNDNIVWCVRSTDITKGKSKLTVLIRRVCSWLSCWLPSRIIYAANVSKDVHEKIGYSKKKGMVISNGFSRHFYEDSLVGKEAACKKLGIPCDKIIVGSVGRFNLVKGHEVFLKSAFLINKYRDDVAFVLVGRGLEVGNSKLEKLLNKYPMDNIYYLGERRDILSCYRAFDIFCLHSVTEGFPNVLGEAMATGLRCVTTDVGDAAFLLNDDRFVVPPNDSEALANALISSMNLTCEEVSYSKMANQKRIVNFFSVEKAVDEYIEVYNDLVK
jgi:glycosyltransferase involved in cell wall biosynthesis